MCQIINICSAWMLCMSFIQLKNSYTYVCIRKLIMIYYSKYAHSDTVHLSGAGSTFLKIKYVISYQGDTFFDMFCQKKKNKIKMKLN